MRFHFLVKLHLEPLCVRSVRMRAKFCLFGRARRPRRRPTRGGPSRPCPAGPTSWTVSVSHNVWRANIAHAPVLEARNETAGRGARAARDVASTVGSMIPSVTHGSRMPQSSHHHQQLRPQQLRHRQQLATAVASARVMRTPPLSPLAPTRTRTRCRLRLLLRLQSLQRLQQLQRLRLPLAPHQAPHHAHHRHSTSSLGIQAPSAQRLR